jgi:cation-transporting ATPase E
VAQRTELRAGLTAAEVARRVAAGAVNRAPGRGSRRVSEIVRANVFTRFNALFGSLCALVLVFGAPVDALFGLVIVVNTAIGVIQELRAKRVLDRVAVLGRSPARVRRDGAETTVDPEQLVVDDVILVASGEPVPVDGTLIDSHELEIDESLLTGEADPVAKAPGDTVMSGSFAVAGDGAYTATRVGADSYSARIEAEASRFSLASSELYRGINSFLRLLTWVIVPVGALLVITQFTRGASVSEAVVGSVAGVVPMIPEGLVLMCSIAFAVGVIRLAQRRCLVQELPAVEVLARVDTLCLDKTGTLTEPGMTLRAVEVQDDSTSTRARAVLAAMVAADPRPNPTLRAIGEGAGTAPGWAVASVQPFSSARKYSAVSFVDEGLWRLGAPEVLLAQDDPARERAETLAAQGLRILALTGPVQALVVLEQRVRPTAARTLAYFGEQGVAVKVISGDNAASVAAIASRLGVAGADQPVDARQLSTVDDRRATTGASLAATLEERAVFGRVTPQQKRSFVGALRSRGHVVAMTGDGVNDALALKDADLGVAMGTGSPATRAVAKVVLLDDDFSVLPQVVAEGRRVLANIERVANLFLTKTVYSILLALLIGVARLPFPFLPRHVTLVATLTIGVPGFFLALAPCDERARPGFVPRVLRFAVPAGVVCAAMTFVAYALARADTATDLVADRATATLTLFGVAFCVLAIVAHPYTPWRLGLLASMAGSFALLVTVPWSSRILQLSYGDAGNDAIAVGCAGIGAAALVISTRAAARLRLPERLSRRGSSPPQ